MTKKIPITVAHGDGIGPEIMSSALEILRASHAPLDIETIEIGEKLYLQGISSGISPISWESLKRTKILLKAPITTPLGGGVKSLNVTIRKTLSLYANIRPCISYSPFIQTKHPHMNVVIIRENEEDLYAGIEYRQTPQVYQCLKLISEHGSERIIRYAFEYAKQNCRKKVSCFSKDNIMKMTDGIFHKVFDRIAREYPDIESDHWIIDIGAARLADTPEEFDVIVTTNLYGDIISDIAAQITGSIGLGGSSNIGQDFAMFEAIHGSAPLIAGKNIANPSGLILASIMMLVHLGLADIAEKIHHAWLLTIEDGIHTADIYHPPLSKEKVGTKQFTQALIARLSKKPQHFSPIHYEKNIKKVSNSPLASPKKSLRQLIGIDVFVYDYSNDIESLAKTIKSAETENLSLDIISTKGLKVWPKEMDFHSPSDHFICRFKSKKGSISSNEIVHLFSNLCEKNIDFIKTENLYTYDGKPGFSLIQGE